MIDIEALAGDLVPGPGPTSKMGRAVAIPVPAAVASVTLVSPACILMGWSFRETTGAAGAVAELLDGGDDNGSFIAALDLDFAFDPAASQSPADQTLTGAASAIAPTIGGAAGTTAFVTSIRIDGLGATAAGVVQATLTGVLGGTIDYEINVPAGATVPIVPVTDQWVVRGLPASAAGQAITLNVPSFGAGNTLSEAEIRGYVQTAAVNADTRWLGDSGIEVTSGLRLRVVSGSVRGAVWIRR